MQAERPSELLHQLARIARTAGQAILDVYGRGEAEVQYKGDHSPLTEADLASHRVIVEGLRQLDPETPVLSEEGRDQPYAERKDRRRFYLVDPLDGTKEFIKRNGEFTVNIALVEEGSPRLGVVHAPVIGRTYLGEVGAGAWAVDSGAMRTIDASGSGQGSLKIVASRSHAGADLQAFLAELPGHELVSMGSSLKLCLVAAGDADLYPRLGPTMEWDTGAAHAVVRAAGGDVVDLAGESLRYNKEDLLNPHFIVTGRREVPWRETLRKAGLGS